MGANGVGAHGAASRLIFRRAALNRPREEQRSKQTKNHRCDRQLEDSGTVEKPACRARLVKKGAAAVVSSTPTELSRNAVSALLSTSILQIADR